MVAKLEELRYEKLFTQYTVWICGFMHDVESPKYIISWFYHVAFTRFRSPVEADEIFICIIQISA